MKFGEKIKKLRKNKGMNQSELAKMLGVSLRTVQNYETSGMHPKQRDIYYKIADTFEVDVNYLLTEEEEVIRDAYEKGGVDSMRDVEKLVDGVCGLFSGGSLPQEDMDAAMKAISDAYFSVKEENKKYIPKKYVK